METYTPQQYKDLSIVIGEHLINEEFIADLKLTNFYACTPTEKLKVYKCIVEECMITLRINLIDGEEVGSTLTIRSIDEVKTNDIFTDKFLHEIGFMLTKVVCKSTQVSLVKHIYDCEAVDNQTHGIFKIKWSTEGKMCSYFGDILPDNISVQIFKEDKLVFDGFVTTQDNVSEILNLIQ